MWMVFLLKDIQSMWVVYDMCDSNVLSSGMIILEYVCTPACTAL